MLRDPLPRDSHHRDGAVLIIVAGLASILLVLSVTFLARMRSDSREMRAVVDQAQARLMMHAAVMYIQECSRIGWGDRTGECCGWTDVRDGSLGPRGPRPAAGAGAATGIPAPEWWSMHADWPPYKAYPDEVADFPALGQRKGGWPLPGTATRCPMAVAVRPPFAVQLTVNYNPVPTPVAYRDPAWNTPWNPRSGDPSYDWGSWPAIVQWPVGWIDRIFDPSHGAKGMLDPQPVAETWTDFCAGAQEPAGGGDWKREAIDADGVPRRGQVALAVQPGSENRSWFRVYRELQADHDDIDQPDDHLWWDKVALYDPADPSQAKYNWSVFIISCGAGGTRGYRFWNDAEIAAWEARHRFLPGVGRCLEPVTAEESGLFPDQRTFRDLLESSQILWFRCEWSALQSGARDNTVYNDPVFRVGIVPMGVAVVRERDQNWWVPSVDYDYNAQYASTSVVQTGTSAWSDTRSSSPKTYGGNLRWIQRLDRDPVKW